MLQVTGWFEADAQRVGTLLLMENETVIEVVLPASGGNGLERTFKIMMEHTCSRTCLILSVAHFKLLLLT